MKLAAAGGLRRPREGSGNSYICILLGVARACAHNSSPSGAEVIPSERGEDTFARSVHSAKQELGARHSCRPIIGK